MFPCEILYHSLYHAYLYKPNTIRKICQYNQVQLIWPKNKIWSYLPITSWPFSWLFSFPSCQFYICLEYQNISFLFFNVFTFAVPFFSSFLCFPFSPIFPLCLINFLIEFCQAPFSVTWPVCWQAAVLLCCFSLSWGIETLVFPNHPMEVSSHQPEQNSSCVVKPTLQAQLFM